MLSEIRKWLADPIPKMMIVGELQDGLVFDSAYKKVTGKPLSHHVIPLFAGQRRHRLIFLTKSAQVQHALELSPTPQVVFSWSVNAEEVGAKWEHGTPLPSLCFSAAEKMKKAGWPIRFRLDPMIPVPGWQRGYAEAIKRINASLRARSYRGLRNAARSNDRDESIFDYLTPEKDPSGFKYRIPFHAQVEMFRFAIDRLKSTVKPALCKEDRALWKALGLRFEGCHCLLGRNDAVVQERTAEMKHSRAKAATHSMASCLPIVASS